MKNGFLKAELKDLNDNWKEDIIQAPNWTVENKNGKFVKDKKKSTNYRPLIPEGNWIKHAKDCSYDGETLKCKL